MLVGGCGGKAGQAGSRVTARQLLGRWKSWRRFDKPAKLLVLPSYLLTKCPDKTWTHSHDINDDDRFYLKKWRNFVTNIMFEASSNSFLVTSGRWSIAQCSTFCWFFCIWPAAVPCASGTSTSIQWYSVVPNATKWYHVGHSYEPFPFLLSPTPSSPLDTASKCPQLTRAANNSCLITGTGHSYRCSSCHVYAYLKIHSPTCP